MPNKRLFYAVTAVAIAPLGITAGQFTSAHVVHGAQSVGITTSFNLEQIFELGQISIYENIENIPNVEVTMERVIDGYCPIYLMGTPGSTSTSLAGRSNAKCIIGYATYDDTQTYASGTPIAVCTMSGQYVSTMTYSLSVDGNATEQVTFVGNNKVWETGVFVNFSQMQTAFQGGQDYPLAVSGSGGVNRREDLIWWVDNSGILPLDANGQILTNEYTVFPSDIDGISSSGTNIKSGDDYTAHVQSFSVSTNLGRTELFELGRRGPYHRFANFPTEVTCEITTIGVKWDNVSATEAGVLGNGNNLTDRTIKIQMRDGLYIDLGKKNKLASTNIAGGNAGTGGGNVTMTYNYSNFNDLSVYHPRDVSGLSKPSA